MRRLGASEQLAIVSLYAWCVTVAPAAWSNEAPWAARVAAVLGLATLLTAPVVERRLAARTGPQAAPLGVVAGINESTLRRSRRVRMTAVWGLATTSGAVWLLSSGRGGDIDAVRGVLGMIGWALVAFAAAGPALESTQTRAAALSASLPSRRAPAYGLTAILAVTAILAWALQLLGWHTQPAEAAVLARLVTIAGGLALVSLATRFAIVRRHGRARPEGHGANRQRRWRVGLLVAAVVALVGAAFIFMHGLYARAG